MSVDYLEVKIETLKILQNAEALRMHTDFKMQSYL